MLSVADKGGGSRGEVIKPYSGPSIYEIGAPGVGFRSRAVLMWYPITI